MYIMIFMDFKGKIFILTFQSGADFGSNPASGYSQISPNSSSPGRYLFISQKSIEHHQGPLVRINSCIAYIISYILCI